MASKSNDTLILVAAALGGLYLFRNQIGGILQGPATASQGIGAGVSDLAQGAGMGIGDAFQGVGSAVQGVGGGIGAIGSAAGSAAQDVGSFLDQARLDAEQASTVRRNSQTRLDNLLSQEQAAFDLEKIRQTGAVTREKTFQNAYADIPASFENATRTLRSTTQIPADFTQTVATALHGAENRALRGADIALRSANSFGSSIWDNANAVFTGPKTNLTPSPSPRPVTPPLNPVANAPAAAVNQAKYNPNIAIAAQAIKEQQAAAAHTAASASLTPAKIAASNSSSKPPANAAKIYNPNNYQVVVVGGITRTVKR